MKTIVDKHWVSNFVDKMAIEEVYSMFTELINGEYTVEQLKQDFDEWVVDNTDFEMLPEDRMPPNPDCTEGCLTYSNYCEYNHA